MIKIKAPETNKIYGMLTRKRSSFSGESWKNSAEDNIIEEIRNLKLGPLELLEPLDFMTQTILKTSRNYASIVEIFARNKDSFLDTSEEYTRRLNNRQLYFIPTSDHLTGYIAKNIEGDIYPLAAIIENQAGNSRALGMGLFGSKPQLLDGPINFRIEMGRLTDLTNDLINSIYDRNLGKRGNNSPIINLSFIGI